MVRADQLECQMEDREGPPASQAPGPPASPLLSLSPWPLIGLMCRGEPTTIPSPHLCLCLSVRIFLGLSLLISHCSSESAFSFLTVSLSLYLQCSCSKQSFLRPAFHYPPHSAPLSDPLHLTASNPASLCSRPGAQWLGWEWVDTGLT